MTTVGRPLVERMAELCDRAGHLCTGSAEAAAVASIRERLDEPLRVAIAGRAKTGKSTLLNALVGERMAPTDAGECTRIVTWYREGLGFQVIGHLKNGASQELEFRRGVSAVEIDFPAGGAESIDRLEVRWPTTRLSERILIDTPGLAGLTVESDARTRAFLDLDDEGHGEADAVIYLMRHMHRRDKEFLEAFHDRSLTRPSPFNAVAVLSRADEIGAGRLDAMDSAAAIADRYESNEWLKALCSAVVPVAGLIAETAQTLTEAETAALRGLAQKPPDFLAELLLSVDRFTGVQIPELDGRSRRALIDRFGLFGVRFAVGALHSGQVSTAADLAALLYETSGVGELANLIDHRFARRSEALKSRSALVQLKQVARRLHAVDAAKAVQLLAAVEEVEAAAAELGVLRLLHLVSSGVVDLDDADRSEVERLSAGATIEERLGVPSVTSDEDMRPLVLSNVERWRRRAGHPLASSAQREAYDLIAHSYEELFLELSE